MASIQGIYIALFGRPADPEGLEFWTVQTKGGTDLSFLVGRLTAADEYQELVAGKTPAQVINAIYQQLYGRDADATGLAHYLAELNSGRQSIETIAINILDGTSGSDLLTLNAKIESANLFTAGLDLDVEIDAYAGNTAETVGREFIADVDGSGRATQEEVDAAIQRLLTPEGEAPQEPSNPGNPGGGGGGGVPAPVFFVTEVNGEISFSGDATGPITYSTVGNVTTFSRQGADAANTVTAVTTKDINLAADQELRLTGDQADDQDIDGTGRVLISGLDADDDISGITVQGDATLEGSFILANGVALSPTVDINVASGQTLTLTATQAAGIDFEGAGKVVVSGSTGDQTINVLTSGGNTINGGAGADIITGGAGNDRIDGGDVAIVSTVPGPVIPGARETVTFSIEKISGFQDNTGTVTVDMPGNDDLVINYGGRNQPDSSLEIAQRIETFLEARGYAVTVTDATASVNVSAVATTSGDKGNFSVTEVNGDRNILNFARQEGTADRVGPPVTSAVVSEASDDQLTGGAGADTFVIKASFEGALDHITDFNVAQGDKIDFGTNVDFKAVAVTGASLSALVNDAMAKLGAGEATTFVYDTRTYVVFDNDNDGSFENGLDQLVDITGVNGTLTDASFVAY